MKYVMTVLMTAFLTSMFISPKEDGLTEHSEAFSRCALVGVPALFLMIAIVIWKLIDTYFEHHAEKKD